MRRAVGVKGVLMTNNSRAQPSLQDLLESSLVSRSNRPRLAVKDLVLGFRYEIKVITAPPIETWPILKSPTKVEHFPSCIEQIEHPVNILRMFYEERFVSQLANSFNLLLGFSLSKGVDVNLSFFSFLL